MSRADDGQRPVVPARPPEPARPRPGRVRGTAVVSAVTVAASLVLLALVTVVAVWVGGIVLAPSGATADHPLVGLQEPAPQPPPPQPVVAGTPGDQAHRPASHHAGCRADLG